MTSSDIAELVERELATAGGDRAPQVAQLRRSLVRPEHVNVINRIVRDGQMRDHVVAAWLVFVEDPASGSGYRIVFDPDDKVFGLATAGFPTDPHMIVCGWYGDLITTFVCM